LADLKFGFSFKDKKKNYVCSRCKEKFCFEDTGVSLCPYCFAVVLGEVDDDWLPEISFDSMKKEAGLH